MTLIDDVSGEAADETVAFSLDGVGYEIELTTSNAHRMRAEVMAWANAGHAVDRVNIDGERIPTTQDERDAIRAWAGLNGYVVMARGKLKFELIDAYRGRAQSRRSR